MAVSHSKKGLGRGLSALIPDADMEFLSRIARGDAPSAPIRPRKSAPPQNAPAPEKRPARAVAPAASRTAARQVNTKPQPTRATPEQAHEIEGASQSVNQSLMAKSATQRETALGEGRQGVSENRPSNLLQDESLEKITLKTREGSHKETGAAGKEAEADIVSSHATEWIDITLIKANPYQPRRTFSEQEMQDLATSIREHGVLQPILVRPVPADDSAQGSAYQLVAGERRWRAAQLAGLRQIPAISRPVSDQQALELALIENVQRHDITPLDAALAYRRLAQEFSLSQDAVAQRVGKSRVAVANTLRLLDLPSEAQKAIEDGVLSEGHGRAILLASGDGARRAVFRRTLREKLSVRATEDLARQTLSAEDDTSAASVSSNGALNNGAEGQGTTGRKGGRGAKLSSEHRALEDKLQKHFQTRVRLKPRSKGGQLVIEYFSQEDLDRILRLFQGE
jgi:ParB family chromosome partitioning protein